MIEPFALAAFLLFLSAAGLGVMTNRPTDYGEPLVDPREEGSSRIVSLAQLAGEDDLWNRPRSEATRMVAVSKVDTLRVAQVKNTTKAKILVAAMVLQVAGVASISAVVVIAIA
jgi:hypothetical protein